MATYSNLPDVWYARSVMEGPVALMADADQQFLRVWTIPVGQAWVTVALSAPTDRSTHTGARLQAQGRAIASLGKAIAQIRIRLDADLKKIERDTATAATPVKK